MVFTTDAKPATDTDRHRLDTLLARQPQLSILPDTQLLDYFRSLAGEVRLGFKRHVLNTYGANVLTSVIVACELRYGAARRGSKRLTRQVEAVLGALTISPLESDVERLYAAIRVALEKKGTPIGAHDQEIAAVEPAIQHGESAAPNLDLDAAIDAEHGPEQVAAEAAAG